MFYVHQILERQTSKDTNANRIFWERYSNSVYAMNVLFRPGYDGNTQSCFQFSLKISTPYGAVHIFVIDFVNGHVPPNINQKVFHL